MERTTNLILIVVLAVMHGIFGILRAFEWFRVGLDLSRSATPFSPFLSVFGFISGKLVLLIALLYILFALGALSGHRWAWGLGLGVSLVTGLGVSSLVLNGT